MKSSPRLALLTLVFTASVFAQNPPQEFRILKISRELITTPQFSYSGAEQLRDVHDRWLRVEVQFSAAPNYTDELTFRYYIAIGGKVLTGAVTYVHILAGRELYSVMYVPPHALTYFLQNRPPNTNSVENIAVQIVQKSEVKDELSLSRAQVDWYKRLPAFAGVLLNKNETPFAPLFWGRYEQIKTLTH